MEFDEITHRSTKGKIVYRRKKHFFRSQDLKRIADGSFDSWLEEIDENRTKNNLKSVVRTIEVWFDFYYPGELYPETKPAVVYGGGESGGGGAGGDF